MKKFDVLKIVEVGCTLASAIGMIGTALISSKKQEKLIDEAVVKHLTENKK